MTRKDKSGKIYQVVALENLIGKANRHLDQLRTTCVRFLIDHRASENLDRRRGEGRVRL